MLKSKLKFIRTDLKAESIHAYIDKQTTTVRSTYPYISLSNKKLARMCIIQQKHETTPTAVDLEAQSQNSSMTIT